MQTTEPSGSCGDSCGGLLKVHPCVWDDDLVTDVSNEELDQVSKVSLSVEENVVELEKETFSYGHISLVGGVTENRLVTRLKLGDVECKVLVDSGAESNLIPLELLESAGISFRSELGLQVRGFGSGTSTEVLGRVRTSLNLHGYQSGESEFLVMHGAHINSFVILGTPFIRSNGLIIDIKRRRLRKEFIGGTVWDCYMPNETSFRIVWSKLPLTIKQPGVLRPNEIKLLKAQWDYPEGFENANSCHVNEPEFYFVDETDASPYLQMFSGLVPVTVGDQRILVRKTGTKMEQVRVGQKIGTASSVIDREEMSSGYNISVVVMDDDLTTAEDSLGCLNEVDLQDHLTEGEKEAIRELLENNKGVFGRASEVGLINVPPHGIELTDYTPIFQRPRRFPEPINEELERQCGELQLLDVIEPSSSGWSSPVVPIRKKDGTIRLCIDYRRLNSVTKADKHPLPNLNDAVFGMFGVKYFTTLDLIKGYYQVPLSGETKPFTAFSTARGHWQFKRLSFGMKNAPAAFQRTMKMILSGLSWRKVIVYIDDILIMGDTFNEHAELCRKVLRTLEQYGIKLNQAKCKWFCSEVEFLGHVVGRAGLKKPDTFVNEVKNFPRPTTKTQLRRFLGLLNFQRKFIPNCSLIMRPLSAATGGRNKKGRIDWTQEMEQSFTHLKELMAKDVQLVFPDYSDDSGPLSVFTDASATGIGACLTQVQGGEQRVIAYASVAFNSAEVRYSTLERELAAIRWALRTFRPFIFGVEFVVYTDHRPLLHLYNLQIVNMRLARTFRELGEYNFTVKYTPGRDNVVADALSRNENHCC